MAEFNPFVDNSDKPSSGLGTITVLTIIWSIITIIQAVWGYFTAEKNYEDLKNMLASGQFDEAPGFVKSMFNEETMSNLGKMLDNKLPIMICGLIGGILCLYGALEMRKLKKEGFFLWLTGELLPLASMLIFIGASSFSGLGLINLFFPMLFIVLYVVHVKELR